MRAKKENEKAFTKLLGELRVLSNDTRQQTHNKIINWIDSTIKKDGSIGNSLVVILPTAGCKYAMAKHGGCSMCTLPTDNPLNPPIEMLEALPERIHELFLSKGGSEYISGIKFYTSGSFLDRWELPVDIRNKLLKTFVDLVDEITVETRCEFVTRKNLQSLATIIPPSKLIVAIGQESTDDEINKRSINKGHKLIQFERAVKLLHEYNFIVKGYILLKSIFISEIASIRDAINSAKIMKKLKVEYISINSAYIGKGTLMDKMYHQRLYQPPWLWTVYEVTFQIKKIVGNEIKVICDPVAAGSDRGPSNCGKCDKRIKETLKRFSANQNIEELNEYCDCLEIYNGTLVTEHLQNGIGLRPNLIKLKK